MHPLHPLYMCFCTLYSTVLQCSESLFQAQDAQKQAQKRQSVAGTMLYFSSYCTLRLKMFYFLSVCLFLYSLCEKHYKSIPVQDYMTDCIIWVIQYNTLLDLWTHSWNGTCLFVGDLLHPNLGLKNLWFSGIDHLQVYILILRFNIKTM